MRETTWERTEETEGRAERRATDGAGYVFRPRDCQGRVAGIIVAGGPVMGTRRQAHRTLIDVSVNPRDGGVKGATRGRFLLDPGGTPGRRWWDVGRRRSSHEAVAVRN